MASKRNVETARGAIEHLVGVARVTGSIDEPTIRWLGGITDKLFGRHSEQTLSDYASVAAMKFKGEAVRADSVHEVVQKAMQ